MLGMPATATDAEVVAKWAAEYGRDASGTIDAVRERYTRELRGLPDAWRPEGSFDFPSQLRDNALAKLREMAPERLSQLGDNPPLWQVLAHLRDASRPRPLEEPRPATGANPPHAQGGAAPGATPGEPPTRGVAPGSGAVVQARRDTAEESRLIVERLSVMQPGDSFRRLTLQRYTTRPGDRAKLEFMRALVQRLSPEQVEALRGQPQLRRHLDLALRDRT